MSFSFRSVADGMAMAFFPELNIAQQSLAPSVIQSSSPGFSILSICKP